MAIEPSRGPVSRWFDRWVRSLTLYQARPRSRSTELSEEPEPEQVERVARLAGWLLAIVAPLGVCLALALARNQVDRSTAVLVLVLPVVLVAVIGGPGPAVLAAIVASLSFDVLMTRPYDRLEIHAAEDVEATVILLVVGVVVGQLVARETRSRARSKSRGKEVEALVAMVAAVAKAEDDAEVTGRALASLEALLDLRECRWAPGYHGGAYPRLTRTGDVRGRQGSSSDLSPLPPSGVEVPVTHSRGEIGHLILVPAGSAPVSREQRIVVIAIADVLGLALARTVQR